MIYHRQRTSPFGVGPCLTINFKVYLFEDFFIGAIEIAFIVWGYLLFISKFFEVVEICSKLFLRLTLKFLERRREVPKKNGPYINMLLLQNLQIRYFYIFLFWK